MSRMAAEGMMRPIARQYDEEEHTDPWEFFQMMWDVSRGNRDATSMGGGGAKKNGSGPSENTLLACMQIEELAWGDAGLYLSIPNPGLGGAAVAAAGTPEQKERFLARFKDGEPKWGAMAITEPNCGSDSANIQTPARLDGDDYLLNGEKNFVTILNWRKRGTGSQVARNAIINQVDHQTL